MSRGNVLVVEDDADLGELIRLYLETHHYHVRVAGTGKEGLAMFQAEHPDMVVLDIELPDLEGTEVCRNIRETSNVPLIFVTCRGDAEDIYQGLALGADDYLTKPFDPAELLARIQGHLRKRSVFQSLARNKGHVWSYGDLMVDFQQMEVRRGGNKIHLHAKEMQLLRFFIENPNRVFSIYEIFDRVWGVDSESDITTVYSHIHTLRRKLQSDSHLPELIRTVRGIGYKFVVE